MRAIATPASRHKPWRPWRWAAVGMAAGALTILLLLAPARWLAALLTHASDGMVTLMETEGTLWTGTGVLTLSGGSGSRDRTQLPGRVQWRIRPALLGAKLRISADCCTPGQPLEMALKLRRGGADLALADSYTRLPATVLAGLGTPWNTIRPKGNITLETQELVLRLLSHGAGMTGRAELTASGMSSNLSTVRPLGSYRLELNGGDTLSFALSTLEGSLQLSGAGSLTAGNLRFRGEAEAAEGMEAELANLLNLIGRRRGNQAIISFG